MARTEKMIFSYVVPVFIVAALELAFGIIGESLLMILPPTPAGTRAGDIYLESVSGCHWQGEVLESAISHIITRRRL